MNTWIIHTTSWVYFISKAQQHVPVHVVALPAVYNDWSFTGVKITVHYVPEADEWCHILWHRVVWPCGEMKLRHRLNFILWFYQWFVKDLIRIMIISKKKSWQKIIQKER